MSSSSFLRTARGVLVLVVLSVLLGSVGLQQTGGSSDTGGVALGDPTGGGGGSGTLSEEDGTTSTAGQAAGGEESVAGEVDRLERSVQQQAQGLECSRGRNGGPTDTGVTGDKIKLAATVVQSGIGASFLGSSPIGMQAVVRKVNSAGGVCGRLLELDLVDDGWDAKRGLQFIRNFIAQGVFAMPVTPSSEGLTAAIESGDISKAGMPVVGSDGMLIQQYENPWVWPVATATVSTMRVMAKHAYHEKGIRRFGLVYDKFYRFGREGADAFKRYVETLPGAELRAYVGINPGQPNYSSDIEEFNRDCADRCEFVGLLLEPGTAETWIAGRPQFGTKMTSGAQTLFNERFAQNCGKTCGGMLVWSGYNPAVGRLASLTDINTYIQDVRSVSPTVDVSNQFLEGAYIGMSVFVEALRQVGPNLTRDGLKQALDSMDYASDFSSPLVWRQSERHANQAAQAFSVVVAQGSFSGWRDERTGWVTDPALG